MSPRLARGALALLAAAFACAPALLPARADDQPSLERLRRDLGYLASPDLEGRGTGTKGCEAAAAYAVERFREIGLEPAGEAGPDGRPGFLQHFQFTAGIEVEATTALALVSPHARLEPKLRDGFTPLGFSASGAIADVEVVFCGYGITASEPAYDDYAGVDVKGKVALVIDGSPGLAGKENDRSAALRRYGQLRMKAMNAREHGAVALVVVAREAPSAGGDPALIEVKGATLSGDAGIMAIDLKRSLGETLFAIATGGRVEDLPLAALQADLDEALAPRSRPLDLVRVTLRIDLHKDRRESANVLARVPGTDPALAGEYVMIGAHYDHLGHGDMGGSLASKPGIHYGADDNASGSAAVIEVARLLSKHPPRRGVVFALWSGEELGLLGSSHFVRQPTAALEPAEPAKGAGDGKAAAAAPAGTGTLPRCVAYVNLDMVGRLRDGKLTVGGYGTAAEWAGVVDEPAAALGLVIVRDQDGFGPSDYSAFYGGGVPVLNLFTGVHPQYHTPEDTADRIEWEGLGKVTALAATLVRRVADTPARPTFQKTGGNPHDRAMSIRGPSVYLGTIPDYSDTEAVGVRLAGVREGSPADKAGLKTGDRVVRFDGKEIRDVQDYTYALFARKPGDKVMIIVRRGGELVEVVAVMGRKGGEPAPDADPHQPDPADPHQADPHQADPHRTDPHHGDPHHGDPHHAPAPAPRPTTPKGRRATF